MRTAGLIARWLGAVVLAAGAVAAPAAAHEDPALTYTPQSGPPGTEINLSGHCGFDAVLLELYAPGDDPDAPDTIPVDEAEAEGPEENPTDFDWQLTLTVPADGPEGAYTIAGVCYSFEDPETNHYEYTRATFAAGSQAAQPTTTATTAPAQQGPRPPAQPAQAVAGQPRFTG